MNKKYTALLLTLLMLLVPILGGCTQSELNTAIDIAEALVSDKDSSASKAGGADEPLTVYGEADQEETEKAGEILEEIRETEDDDDALVEDGWYYAPEDVALFLHTFGHLPDNYITKREAEDMGWDSSRGNLWDVADGYCIGGDRFGNREGLLPDRNGVRYFECDVNYDGGYRGSERLIFSSDGSIYYTGDHYASFTLLYEP